MSLGLDPHHPPVPSPRHHFESSLTLASPSTSALPQPSDPLLLRVDSFEQYDDMLARTHSHTHSNSQSNSHAHEYSRTDMSWEGGLSMAGAPLNPREQHALGERRRIQRWRTVKTIMLAIITAWAIYSAVRYFVAFVMYRSSARRALSLALGTSSLVTLILVLIPAFIQLVLQPLLRSRPDRHKVAAHIIRASVSFLTISPAVVNFALVFVWRDSSDPALRLRGRCSWDIDVNWTAGLGTRCASPVWGVWLAAALARLILTAVVLGTYHVASVAYDRARSYPRLTLPEMKARPGSSAISHSPQPVTFNLRSRESSSAFDLPSPPVPSPSPRRSIWERRASGSITSGTAGSHTVISHEVGFSATEARPAPAPAHTQTSVERPDPLAAQDLQNFANTFRDLVGQVSRDLEDGRLSPPSESPRTPPLHSVMSTHIPYTSLDEFGRPIPPLENVAIFGRAVRRMPTIESMGTLVTTPGAEFPPRSPTVASIQSRAPTRMSMATVSTPSAPPSRANSLTQGRGQTRDAPHMASDLQVVDPNLRHTPVSMSSFHTALTNASGSNSTSGSGGSALSRANSLNAVDLLTPVDEHHDDLTPGQIFDHRTASPEDYGQVIQTPLGESYTTSTLTDSQLRPKTAPQ